MKVSVVGCGYVGLVTGLGLASLGHKVTGIDISIEKVTKLNAGISPFYEPGVVEHLSSALKTGAFRATRDLKSVADSDVTFICVGTPSREDGSIDLTSLTTSVRQVAGELTKGKKYTVIAVRSTVVPGTTEKHVFSILREIRHRKIGTVVNPEFLREGQAFTDFMHPDRIVIGQQDKKSGDAIVNLFREFDAPIFRTNFQTAELIKYSSNTLLASLISFSNEIANICETIPGADVEQVLNGVKADRRLTLVIDGKRVPAGINHYLRAGCGFGGSCLPKDLRALIRFAEEKGLKAEFLNAVNCVNNSRAAHFVQAAERRLNGLAKKRALVLGAAFKADTDDIRDSPGIEVAKTLVKAGANVSISDPLVTKEQIVSVLGKSVTFIANPREQFRGYDICFVTTTAKEFNFINNETRVRGNRHRHPIVMDGRRALSESFAGDPNYFGIGMGPPTTSED